MITRITRFKKYAGVIPERVHSELGHLIVFFLKELLKIENKYGYKVPLLIKEHRSNKTATGMVMVSILRLNEHFLSTLIPKLEKSEDMFVHMEKSVPTII